MGIVDDFISALKPETEETKNRTYNAAVSKIDDEGVVWVYVAGSEKETPTAITSSEVKRGDAVNVEWRNNKLYIAGNYSNPAVGTTRVANVEVAAQVANQAANNAVADAGLARDAAEQAQESANAAQTSANNAQVSALNASEYASRALGNLSTVQSVAETLTWITQHGTMTLTSDVTLDPTHVYFVLDPLGDYTVGGNTYSIVAEPDVADIGTYYELSIDESLNNYVGTHLALTQEGLWLLPASSGTNKVLIATGAGVTYTTPGTYIIDASGNTIAMFGENAIIGKSDGTQSYIYEDYHSLQMIDKDGDPYVYFSDLRDANGDATVTDTFTGDGTTRTFTLTLTAKDTSYSVTVSDSSGGTVTKLVSYVSFSTAPTNGATITVSYVTQSNKAKSFTLGTRQTGTTTAPMSVAEGTDVEASGYSSHAEGGYTKATERYSHAEGYSASANGYGSHAEGGTTQANEHYAHAEGDTTKANGVASHAEGSTTYANGDYSHAQGYYTKASSKYQTALGKFNVEDNADTYAVIVGNGTSNSTRSDALTVDWSGNVDMAGHINSFYKITSTSITCPATAAHGYQSSASYTIPSADRVSGYQLAGIVGMQSASSRIVPFNYYKESNTSLKVGFVNVTATATTSDVSVTFHLLWIKATSA